jgi:hypothetical protein
MIQMHYFRRFCENSLYLIGDAVAAIHRGSERVSLHRNHLSLTYSLSAGYGPSIR